MEATQIAGKGPDVMQKYFWFKTTHPFLRQILKHGL